MFNKNDKLLLEVNTDANYARSVANRRSNTNYCIFLASNLVTWRNKKQNKVVRSSAKLKFGATAQEVYKLL